MANPITIWVVVIILCCLTFTFWLIGLPFAEAALGLATTDVMAEEGVSIMAFLRILYYILPFALSGIFLYWGYMASVQDQAITQPW